MIAYIVKIIDFYGHDRLVEWKAPDDEPIETTVCEAGRLGLPHDTEGQASPRGSFCERPCRVQIRREGEEWDGTEYLVRWGTTLEIVRPGEVL